MFEATAKRYIDQLVKLVSDEGEGIRIVGEGSIEYLSASVEALTLAAKAEKIEQVATEAEKSRVFWSEFHERQRVRAEAAERENVVKFFECVYKDDLTEGNVSKEEALARAERNQGPKGLLSVAQVHQLLTGCGVCVTEKDREVLESFKGWADSEARAQERVLALYWFIEREQTTRARRNLEHPLQVHPTREGVEWLLRAGPGHSVNDLPWAFRAKPVEPTEQGYQWLKENPGKTLAELPKGWQYRAESGRRPGEPATARLLQIEHAKIAFGRAPLPNEEELRKVGWNGQPGSLKFEDCQVWLDENSNNLHGVPQKPRVYRSWKVLHPTTLAKYPGLVGGAVGFPTESERTEHDAELRGR